MALLHGYPLGLFDHPKWTSQVRAEDALNATLELDKTGEQVKGSNSWASKSTTRGAWLSELIFVLVIFVSGAGNDPASKITITLAFTSVTAGNRF